MSAYRPRLQSLIFELTQACNHVCLHCYNVWQGPQALPYPRGQLDTPHTLALLGKALDETICSHVTITGGEPLLRHDLFQVLEFLQQRRVRVTLISNGRLLTDSMISPLIARGVDLFELPLLSHQPQVHDRLSGSSGAWDAVLSAMASIRFHRGQVVSAFVATRLNIDHLQETMRLAFAFGARGLMLNRFNPGGRGRENILGLLPSLDQVKHALAIAESTSVELGLPVSCSIPIQPCLIDTSAYPHIGFGFCAAGTDRAYYTLDPLGNLRACNHTDLILGNLLQASFSDIISSPRMSEFTSAIPTYCLPCKRRFECQGGCKASAQVCYGSLNAPDPFLKNALSLP